MTTYATNIPFPVPDRHTFVELRAPNPDIPSHFISRSGRYFPNVAGRVFVPEEHVEEILADGCTLAPGVSLDRPTDPPGLVRYQAPAPAPAAEG